jgi:hypothetical protein
MPLGGEGSRACAYVNIVRFVFVQMSCRLHCFDNETLVLDDFA